MGDDAFDTLAFTDELPSLFADDQQQPLPLTPYVATVLLTPSESAPRGNALGLLAAPPPNEPLSAEEIAQLLRSIDSNADADESEEIAALQLDVQQQPQRAPKQTQPTGGKLPAKTKTKRKKAPSRNPNKARDSRKEELVYLRKTVLELETRLSVLQKKSKGEEESDALTTTTRAAGMSRDSSYSVESASHRFGEQLGRYTTAQSQGSYRALLDQGGEQDNVALQDVWREIARHQCDERDRSERENIRLRVVLESQLKVAKSLEKFMLLKAASTMEIGKTVDIRRHHHSIHSNISEDPSDAEIYHDLLVGVEQSIAEVDAVYEANGLADMEKTQMNAQMRFDPENGMFVEVSATKVLPFGIHETGSAVWDHYMFAKQRMPSRYYSYHSHKSIDETDDTIVEDFSLELHAKNTRARFRVRQIMRRVVEEERIVIVWRTFFDPIEFSDQQLSSVRFFEKGYIVIRKASPSASKPSVTLLQPCYIIFPHSSTLGGGVAGENESVVGTITDFMLTSTVANVAATHQMVENVLLEQTLKSQGLESEGVQSRQ